MRFNFTALAAASLACVLTAGVAVADSDDRADPFTGSTNQTETSTSGSFFGLFDSGETKLSSFERPSAGYGAVMARRPESIRMSPS